MAPAFASGACDFDPPARPPDRTTAGLAADQPPANRPGPTTATSATTPGWSITRWLPAAPSATAIARRQTSATLNDWGLVTCLDDARLAVSELVTNAVTASTGPGTDPSDPLLQWIGLRLWNTGRRLVIDVFDAAPGRPTLRPCGSLAEHGRGLNLVAAVAILGTYVPVTGPGKIVWAALEHHGAAPTGGTTPLSRRVSPGPHPLGGPQRDPDLALLRRVRDGLLRDAGAPRSPMLIPEQPHRTPRPGSVVCRS